MAGELEYFGVPYSNLRDVENRLDFIATAGQTVFPFTYQIGYLDVIHNGSTLSALAGDFTATNGTSFTLTTPCVAGAIVGARSRRQVPVTDVYTTAQANAMNNSFFGAATGTGDAAIVGTTPLIGFTQTDGREVSVRWPGTNTSLTPTVNVNGNGVVGVRQAGGQNVPIGSLAPNQELTLRYNSTSGFYEIVVSSALLQIPLVKRQTVVSGPVDVNGLANEIGVGTALAPTLNGSVTPVVAAFAAGFGPNGSVDYVGYINSLLSFPSVPASAISFLTVDRNATTGALTLGSTMAPPQYGTTYAQNAQSVLQFGGAAGATTFLDDFGNTWTAQGGAKVQSNQVKFGTGALGGGGASNALNGSTDYIKTTSVTTLGQGGWSVRCWVNPTSLATNGGIFSFINAGGYGASAFVSTAGKLGIQLSSNGSSNDIANNTVGTITIPTNLYTSIEVTYDAVAGKYFTYVGGVVDQTVTSALRICSATQTLLGATFNGSFVYFVGYLDKFEYLPYCQHPNGVTYSVPTAAPNVATQGYASDWFNTANYTMNQVSAASTAAGTNPTFTTKQRLYVGEVTAGASTVSSTVSYVYNGSYYKRIPNIQALSTRTLWSTNVGTDLVNVSVNIINKTSDSGYVPGNKIQMVTISGAATNTVFQVLDRNTTSIITGSSNSANIPVPAGAPTSTGPAASTSWDTELISVRSW